jgi:hypothetical protein
MDREGDGSGSWRERGWGILAFAIGIITEPNGEGEED